MKKRILVLALCLLLVLNFGGCAAASDSVANGGAIYDAPEMAPEYELYEDLNRVETGELTADSASGTQTSLPADRKMIQTVDMSVETENMDTVLGQIDSRVQELGGYIESSSIHNGSAYSGRRYRSAELTIRIPSENLNQFIDRVGEVSNVVSSNKTVDDVTLTYVATESRMNALKTEEERLLDLMAQAETMDDLLIIESRLTDVRAELEQITSSLRVLDNQVNYATIDLYINEVTEYTPVEEPETIWERISTGFVKSLKGVGTFFEELFVFLVVGSPYFVLIAVLFAVPLLIVLLIIKIVRRTNRKKREKQ